MVAALTGTVHASARIRPKLRATLVQSLEFVGLNIFETGAVMLVEDESHGRSKHLCGASPERDFFQDGNANTDVNIVESTCTVQARCLKKTSPVM